MFTPSVEWMGYPENTFDGLGAHTTTCASFDNLIISEYVEGSYNNKALEIYNRLLDRAEGQESKNLFKILCQEEAKHKLTLETKYDDYMAQMGD